jgi:hypothetical protein
MHLLHQTPQVLPTLLVTSIEHAVMVASDSVHLHDSDTTKLHTGKSILSCMYLGSSALSDAVLTPLS